MLSCCLYHFLYQYETFWVAGVFSEVRAKHDQRRQAAFPRLRDCLRPASTDSGGRERCSTLSTAGSQDEGLRHGPRQCSARWNDQQIYRGRQHQNTFDPSFEQSHGELSARCKAFRWINFLRILFQILMISLHAISSFIALYMAEMHKSVLSNDVHPSVCQTPVLSQNN